MRMWQVFQKSLCSSIDHASAVNIDVHVIRGAHAYQTIDIATLRSVEPIVKLSSLLVSGRVLEMVMWTLLRTKALNVMEACPTA